MNIKVGVSGRHVHLSREDAATLFGNDYKLEPERYLSIPTQFIAKERLIVKGPKGTMENVAIIAPEREITQVEMSKTDCVKLGINPPIRLSGDIKGSGSVRVIGSQGELLLKDGLIIAMRHIHMTTEDAKKLEFAHKDYAMVVVKGERSLVFDFVVIRVDASNTHTELHLDTDEANTANLKTGDEVELLHINDKKLRLEQLISMFGEQQLSSLVESVTSIIKEEKKRVGSMEKLLKVLKS